MSSTSCNLSNLRSVDVVKQGFVGGGTPISKKKKTGMGKDYAVTWKQNIIGRNCKRSIS